MASSKQVSLVRLFNIVSLDPNILVSHLLNTFRCLLALSATTIFLIYGLQRLGSKSDIFALGFGQYDDRAVLGIFGDIARDKSKFVSHSLLIKMVAMANLPQVIIFSLYFALNTIYTSMLSANEWANFSQQKKTLRTTSPEGLQRSTYWLSLPWTYGLPLSISITILHLLISQALFVGRRVIIDVFEQVDLKISQLGVGYSHVAIFASLIFGSAMVLALMVNGLRPLNPCVLAGNNSLAILGALKDIHHYWSLERLVIYYDEASEEELNQLQATATRHLHAPRLEELRQNVGRGRFPLPTIEYEKLEMKV